MKARTWAAVAAVTLVGLASAIPALAAELAAPPRIVGDAVVGSTLEAVVEWTTPPDTTVRYLWDRCVPAPAEEDGIACDRVADDRLSVGVPATYPLTEADLGAQIRVRVDAGQGSGHVSERSALTAAVQPAPPPPPPGTEPEPEPSPEPTPDPAPDPGSGSTPDPVFDSSGTGTGLPPSTAPAPATPTAPATPLPTTVVPLRYLRPFPVVRIRGTIEARGSRVQILRVTAPRGTRVSVVCTGTRCPKRRLTRGPGRVRAFERFLPAGLRLDIRAVRRGRIGKHVRLVFRAGAPPLRKDACALPGRTRPALCPET